MTIDQISWKGEKIMKGDRKYDKAWWWIAWFKVEGMIEAT